MRRLSIAVIAAAATISLTQIATAADITRPVYKAPVPIPVQDWSGIYVGLEGGYGWGKQSTNGISPGGCYGEPGLCFLTGEMVEYIEQPLFYPDIAIPSPKQDGWLFGGFFGAQKQWGSVVLGIEGDIDGANIKGSGTSSAVSKYALQTEWGPAPNLTYFTLGHDVSIQTKVDMLASLRGKIGWAFAPNWLLYGTGGAAWAHVKNTLTESFSFEAEYLGEMIACDPNFVRSASSGTSMFGWAAGAGIDWKWRLDADSALVLGVEYLHYGFPEQTITLADNNGASFAFTAKENVDTVKGRISYLFSIH